MESALARDDASDNSPRPLSNLASCRVRSETFAVDVTRRRWSRRRFAAIYATSRGLPKGDEVFFLVERERERETWRSPAILSWRRCLAKCDPRAKFCVSQSNQSFVYLDARETSNTSQEPCLKTSTAHRAPKTTDGNTSRAEIEGWTRRSGGQQGRREGCAEHGITTGERDERTRPQHLSSNARSGKMRKFLIKFENLNMKWSLSTINLKYYSIFSCINKIITFY